MGGGLKKEYNAGPLPGYDATASDPWPDFFDLNYTLSKQAGGDEVTYGNTPSMPGLASPGLGSLDYHPFEKPKLSRLSSEPLKDPETPAHRPMSSTPSMPSMPISSAYVELSAKASLPFDFDDFLATLKTDEPEEVPQRTGSRFKQFFDTTSPPTEKTKLCQKSSDSQLLMGRHDPLPPFSPLETCGVPLQQTEQLPTRSTDPTQQLPLYPHQQLARRSRRLPKGQPLRRSFSSPHTLESPAERNLTLLSGPEASSTSIFDCNDLDDITEADMVAATSRFNAIKEASLASSKNETATVPPPPEERPVSPPQAPVERERPRFKNQQSSNTSRWSPPTPVSAVNTASHPPASMATAALLQARLLAQQRSAAAAASGLFPGGQVAQLVRPPMPMYQTGMQAGLPLQSAALLYLYL